MNALAPSFRSEPRVVVVHAICPSCGERLVQRNIGAGGKIILRMVCDACDEQEPTPLVYGEEAA